MRKADEVIFDVFGTERVWNSHTTDPRGGLRAFRDFGDNILNDSDDLDDCLVNRDSRGDVDTPDVKNDPSSPFSDPFFVYLLVSPVESDAYRE